MSVKQQAKAAEKKTDPKNSAAQNKIVKKLLRLRKDELATALASFPTHRVEAVLNDQLPAKRAVRLAEGHVQRDERRIVFQHAKAVFNNRMSVVDCTIRNRGERGFMAETKNSISIPKYFELDVPMTGKRLPVMVAWRNGDRLGLVIND